MIEHSIKKSCPSVSRKAALAFLQQAEANFLAASLAGTAAAKPVLLYCSYLNLAKALILTRKLQTNCDEAYHGVKDRRNPRSSTSIQSAYLECEQGSVNSLKVFSEFVRCFDSIGLVALTTYDLKYLMPQVVPGHRLWASAVSSRERFLTIHKINFLYDDASKTVRTTMIFEEADINRLGLTRKRVLSEGRLQGNWKEVATEPNLVMFEQTVPKAYSSKPAEQLDELVKLIRPIVWTSVLSHPPYRRYYLHVSPSNEHKYLLPELLSIYALAFYLGSITRYRPHHFEKITDGPHGRFIQACLYDHPMQFIYLIASEFAMQAITKPALV